METLVNVPIATQPAHGLSPLGIWRSFDGRAWHPIHLPAAVTEGLDGFRLQSGADRLMLSTVNSISSGPQTSALWTSEAGDKWLLVDGVDNAQGVGPGNVSLGGAELHHSESVWTAASNTASSSTGQEWIEVWVSEDGFNWEAIQTGAVIGTQGGFSTGFAGDTVFVWVPGEAD